MASTGLLLDDAPLTSFHKKLTVYSSGGPFIDGFAIAIIGFVWASMGTAFEVSTADKGLIAAAILVGIFVGGATFGWVTDRVGRHVMYIIDLVALAVFSVLCFFATEVWHIVALRFLIGVAIGADYPIATSLLAEYLPSKYRGRMLGATFVVGRGRDRCSDRGHHCRQPGRRQRVALDARQPGRLRSDHPIPAPGDS